MAGVSAEAPPCAYDIVNATIIPLDEAPQGYASFDSGVAKKFVLDPHGLHTHD